MDQFVHCMGAPSDDECDFDFDSANIISELFLDLGLALFNKVFLETLFDHPRQQKLRELYLHSLQASPDPASRGLVVSRSISRRLSKLEAETPDADSFAELPLELAFKYVKWVLVLASV